VKIFLTNRPGGTIRLMARAEGEGGRVGDLVRDLGPGDDFLGHPFGELAALGEGGHDLEPAPGWSPPEAPA
jgi:hypothetical protein